MTALRTSFSTFLMIAALLILSGVGHELSFHPFVPNAAIPFLLFFALDRDIDYVYGLFAVFVLGYFQDLIAGTPLSLHTLLNVGGFIAARTIGMKLVISGVVGHMFSAFLFSVAFGIASISLRSIFGPTEIQDLGPPLMRTAEKLIASGVATATAAVFFYYSLRALQQYSPGRKASS